MVGHLVLTYKWTK